MNSSDSLSRWRTLFWPIHRHELSKVLPLISILFLTCLCQGLLKNLKDTLVITAEGGGAEVIPFLKLWGILPVALLATGTFTYLSAKWGQAATFRAIVGGFLGYFILFVLVLYPNRAILHPHAFADWAESILPLGLHGFVAMFRNWIFTTFYIVAEMWSSIVLSVMFWGLANQATDFKQATRVYGTLAVASNLAAVAAGTAGIALTQTEPFSWLPYAHDAWEQSQAILLSLVALCSVGILAIYGFIFSDSSTEFTATKPKKKAKRGSIADSFRFLSRSPYLTKIALIVLGYNLVINMVEVIWKDQLRILYPEKADYSTYMANLSVAIGLVSCMASFSITSLIRRWGWSFTAILTPLIALVTSAGFFTMMLYGDFLSGSGIMLLNMQPLALAVFFGGTQNCLSKAAKYSVFDATKEMAFIPLDPEIKLQGKAAIDGVGSRLAKSGSSLLFQTLLIFFGSLSACAPIVSVVVFVCIGSWIFAVRSLGSQFTASPVRSREVISSDSSEDSDEEPAAI